MRLSEAFDKFRRVHDELAAVQFALVQSLDAVSRDPTLFRGFEYDLRPTDLRLARQGLDATYFLRLFSQFEAVLRDYWAILRPRSRPMRTPMERPMDRIAIARQIPFDPLSDAHEVREFRNDLAHDPAGGSSSIRFVECKARLNVFVSYLPRQW